MPAGEQLTREEMEREGRSRSGRPTLIQPKCANGGVSGLTKGTQKAALPLQLTARNGGESISP